MNKVLRIGKPFVREINNYCQLVCEIVKPEGETNEIWYQVDSTWRNYLVTENADAFVADLVYYAMSYGVDILSDAPVSQKLLYQLNYHYIPVVSKSKPFFHGISIKAPAVPASYKTESFAATGISCGVDSYYTLLKHLDTEFSDYNIKVALFQDWYSIGFADDEKKKWRSHFRELTSEVANSLGIKAIYVSCNIDEVLPTPDFIDPYYGRVCDKGLYTFKYCSAAFALGKLISKYYFSSGYDIEHFDLKPKGDVFDEDHYSLFNVSNLSNEIVDVFHFGGEATRIDKLNYLSKFPVVQKTLSVCSEEKNCGKCLKCIRTMGELYSIGKIDNFKECFPTEEFINHITRNFSLILANSNNDFFAEIIEKCRENNKPIPIASYLLSPFTRIEMWGRKRFKNNALARKIYGKIKKG